MSIGHVYSQTVADGTATSVVRPSDWNSAHYQNLTISGNTSGVSAATQKTNIIYQGGNNITLALSTGASVATMHVIGPTAAAQTAYVFSNSNNVSFGTNGSTVTATASFSQTADTGKAGTGFTSTTQAGTAVSATLGTDGLSFAQPPFITTYANDLTSGRAGTGFTSTTQAGTAISATLNTNGLSLAQPPFITTYVNDLTSGRAGTGFTSTTTAGTAVVGTLNTAGISLGIPAYLTAAAGGGGIAASISGNSTSAGAGYSNITSGTMILAGGNNITLSQNGASITISGANVGGAQTGISGIAVSNTTYTSGTVSFSNANGVSFGTGAGQAINITHDLQYTSATSAITSNAFPSANTTKFAGTGYTSTTTAGTAIVGTLNTSGLSLAFPTIITNALTTAAQSSASNISAIYGATNNTGGGTATLSGGVSFTNANGATFYTSAGNAIALSYSVPTQTNQTVASGNIAGTGFTSTTTAGTAIVGTLNTAGLSVGVPAFLTTYAAQTADTINLYAAGNTTQLSSTAGVDVRSLSFEGAGIASVGVSNGRVLVSVPSGGGGGDGYNIVSMLTSTSGGGTTGATFSTLSGSIGLMAGSNITLSQTSNTIVINGPTAGGGGAAIGVSTGGNTSNTTGTYSSGSYVLVGGNNVTLSQVSGTGGATLTISVPAGGGIGVSNLGNTFGSTGAVSDRLIFVGVNGIQLSQSTNAQSATISIQQQPLSAWANNLYQFNSQTIQPRQSTSIVFPVEVKNAISFDHVRFPMTVSLGSTTLATTANTTFSGGLTYTFNFGVYASVISNATSLISQLTTNATMAFSSNVQVNANGSQYSVSLGATYPQNGTGTGITATFSIGYAVSTSNIAIATTAMTAFTGMKHFEMPFQNSLDPNNYWMMIGVSSSSATQGIAGLTAGSLVHSFWGMSQPNNTWGFFGNANNATVQNISGIGSFTTAGGGTVAGLGFSNISSTASHVIPYVYMEYDG